MYETGEAVWGAEGRGMGAGVGAMTGPRKQEEGCKRVQSRPTCITLKQGVRV